MGFFGPVGYGSRGREESSSTSRILVQTGVCMGMASKLGETEEEAGFRGNGKSSICPLDIHLEMADRELSNVEKCLYLL